MVLNLGFVFSVLSPRARERFGLLATKIPKDIFSSAAKPVDRYAMVQALQIGDAHLIEQHLVIDPEANTAERYPSADVIGLLGNDLLWRMDIELDVAHRKLNLYEATQCAGPPAGWGVNAESIPLQRSPLGEFYIPVTVNGKKLAATWSTGSSATTLTKDVAKRVFRTASS